MSILSQEERNRFLTLLKNAKHPLLTVHRFPDFDAIGSLLAFSGALIQQGKAHTLWVEEKNLTPFDVFSETKTIRQDFDPTTIDLIISLDCATLERIEGHEKLIPLKANMPWINIDHHQDNTRFGTLNIVPVISSVGELLTTLFQELGWSISEAMAEQLYCAMSYDTGRFAYSSTRAATFEAAAFLVRAGASPEKISDRFDNTKTLADFHRLRAALAHVTYVPDIKTIYTVIPQDAPEAEIKIIDVLRQHQDAEVALVFQELNNNQVKISFRSKSDFNVSAFAKQFGGGGHKKASGAIMQATATEAVRHVLERLRQDWDVCR